MTWLSKGTRPHYCSTPGWRERRREGCQQGAKWKCDGCGKVYVWGPGYGGDYGWTPFHPYPPSGTVTVEVKV